MKKLETIIYIVGPKRSWEFQARHVKGFSLHFVGYPRFRRNDRLSGI